MESRTSPNEDTDEQRALQAAKDDFIAQWGVMGGSWGVNRTMAQIHALLLIADQPLSTDDVMDELHISRGNAHGNIRELVGWGLIRGVIRKGERKELFEAEKDVWKMFCTIARERGRREIDPALVALRGCQDRTKKLKGASAQAFHRQMAELSEFVALAERVTRSVAGAERKRVVPWVVKFLK